MAFLDKIGLEHLWAHIINKLGNKVDKVEGKDLSTNDFTDEEKTKLANAVLDLEQKLDIVEVGAIIAAGDDLNNYKTPGNYICVAHNTSQVLNCPVTTNGFKLIVITGYNQERKHQFLLRGANSDLYYRMFNSTDLVWTNWVNLNTSLTGLGITATVEELNYMDGVTSNVQTQLNAKVPTSRTVNGKALSENITLSAADIGADVSGSASAALTSAKTYTDTEIGEWVGDTTVSQQITIAIADKVDKVDGKGLSTNDYTTAEKNKLSGIATGAEANQNAFGIIKTKSGSVNATVNADAKVDTVTFEAGDNITLITNESTGVIKIVGADAPEAPEASLESLGISATPAEINYLTGASSNIQAQLNSMLDVTETGAAITANSDLNNYKTPGNYICIANNTSTLTNCPVSTQGFKLIVITGYSADRYHQILLRGGSSDFYYRMYNSTDLEWTNWVNLNTTVSLSDLGITATATELNYVDGVTSSIQTQLNAKVPTSRTVNGKALSSNISLTYSDVDAAPEEHTHDASDITAGTLAAACLPNISIDKLVAGTTNTTIPSSLLPAYVDDVLEYAAKSNFPTTGESGKIYVDKTTNLTWRWSGSAYVEISPSLALGTTSSTAYRGDLGTAAYAHAVTNKGIAKSSGLYKITTNSEGHVTAATAVAKADITALGIPASLSDLGVTATATELNYVDGVTSNIQTQLNNRLNLSASGTAINENDDLNDYTTPGVYTAVLSTAQTLSNTPCKVGFKLIVMRGYSSNYISQFIFRGNANRWWYRSYSYVSEPIWTDWHSYLPSTASASGALYATETNGDIQFGTLPIDQGGTGGITAKAAAYNLLNDMDDSTIALTDDSKFVFKLATTGSTEKGILMAKSASIIWDYVKSKADSAYWGVSTSHTKNTILAAPNGSNGAATFRALVAADIPSLPASKITSGTLPIERGGTGGTTAKAATYNLFQDINDTTETAITDTSKFMFAYSSPSVDNGGVLIKEATTVRDYVLGNVTSTELGYLSGVTSAIQTQLNNRLNLSTAGATIPANSDLNDYADPGVYTAVAATTSTLDNCPFTSGGVKLIVMNHYTTNRKCQFLYHATSTQVYYRVYNGSSWYSWVHLDNPGIVYSSSQPTNPTSGNIWLKPV